MDMEVRGQFAGLSSLFPPCGTVLGQVHIPTESSCWSFKAFFFFFFWKTLCVVTYSQMKNMSRHLLCSFMTAELHSFWVMWTKVLLIKTFVKISFIGKVNEDRYIFHNTYIFIYFCEIYHLDISYLIRGNCYRIYME